MYRFPLHVGDLGHGVGHDGDLGELLVDGGDVERDRDTGRCGSPASLAATPGTLRLQLVCGVPPFIADVRLAIGPGVMERRRPLQREC